MSSVEETTDAGLKEILQSNSTVVVDLWAPWCMPCQRMAPILDGLSKEYSDIKFVKINIDDQKETASANNVMSIPTLLMFKDGQVVDSVTGLVPAESLKEKIDNL